MKLILTFTFLLDEPNFKQFSLLEVYQKHFFLLSVLTTFNHYLPICEFSKIILVLRQPSILTI
jgi:hypothetical protein